MNISTKKSTTVIICRAGIIAALYAGLTMAFGALAYGPLQIRPAEALCLLPLFYPEAIVGLYIGCMLANLLSGYGFADIVFGSLITLFAALTTFFLGKCVKNGRLAAFLGGLPPILYNAFGIPIIIILVSVDDTFAAYWPYFASMLLTQSVWIYALGLPMALGIKRLRDRNIRFLL